MGGQQASTVLASVKRDSMQLQRKKWSERAENQFKKNVLEQYEHQGHPYYSSARLWDDGIIDPMETRTLLGLGISCTLNAPIKESNFGIFRM